MNIELSITVWPIVSLVLWFLAWAAVTCLGCGFTVLAWQTAKERSWIDVTWAVCCTSLVWFLQWMWGVNLNEWLKIVLGA